MDEEIHHSEVEQLANDFILSLAQLLRRLRYELNDSTKNNLTISHIGAISQLSQRGSMTTAELARSQFMQPQSMRSILIDLENRQLVERQPHPTDGRQVLFSLTAYGEKLKEQRRSIKKAWLIEMMDTLTADDLKALMKAMPVIERIAKG